MKKKSPTTIVRISDFVLQNYSKNNKLFYVASLDLVVTVFDVYFLLLFNCENAIPIKNLMKNWEQRSIRSFLYASCHSMSS